MHRQFHSSGEFRRAFGRVMALRREAKRYGRSVEITRKTATREPISGRSLVSVVGGWPVDQRRAVMVWLNQSGPFWPDARRHGPDDWLEYDGDVVTETVIGEAGFRALHGIACGLVSMDVFDWRRSPLKVRWVLDDEGIEHRDALVENCWDEETLKRILDEHPCPIMSWEKLDRIARARFDRLVLAGEWLEPLKDHPFSECAAKRFMVLLSILNRFAGAFDAEGRRTPEGHRIQRTYFMGDRALFSNSSETEKHEFQQQLTFPHPEYPERTLFCPWHGKVSHGTLRLHFSWPIVANEPVYVVYAGPKITKR